MLENSDELVPLRFLFILTEKPTVEVKKAGARGAIGHLFAS